MSSISPRIVRLKNGQEVTLRSARPEDAQELTEMLREILGENDFNITTADEFHFDVEQEMEWIENTLEAAGQLVIVATHETKDDAELLGLINFNTDLRKRMQHRGTLSINIRRGWRDQGLGRALLQTLMGWVQEQSAIEKLVLEVFATNERAIGLYRSLGFQEEGRHIKQIKMGPGTYIDVIDMALWFERSAEPR